ncbi:MAG TPA: autotransporter domain-containing protein, partial [Chlamydiales bacterium]|nr:autotransporter domain-containing protein [Chlamydiales bacterium]
TSAFSSASAFNVNGSLNLNSYSNTIYSLAGTGFVTLSADETLMISNGGTTFSGQITGGSGGGGLTLGTGTLILSASGSTPNNYLGTTLISSGATLQAGSTSAFSPASSYTVTGTLNLNGFSNTIDSLNGGGSVTTGGGTLTVGNGGIFSGAITGTGGLTLSGGTLELSGTSNTYSGITIINSGSTLEAGALNAFSPDSFFTVNGTLALNGYSNTLSALAGSGTIVLLSCETLTLHGGTTFSGQITGGNGSGGVTLGSGTLTLAASGSAPNDYFGATLISSGAVLLTGSTSALSPNSSLTVTGTLFLNGNSNTVFSLFGTGLVDSSALATLTVTDGGAFSGTMTGLMNLAVRGGDLELSGTSNSYVGFTLIQGGTLTASANGALSPNSRFVLATPSSLLQIGTTTQTILGLSGNGDVEIASGGSLTFGGIFPSIFNGTITGPGSIQGGAIIKEGSATFTFLGEANLESTTVAAGRMNIDTTSWSSPITVESNAILGGIGTLNGQVTLNNGASIAPGHSSGTLTFTTGNTVTFASDSTYLVFADSLSASDLILAGDTVLNGKLLVATSRHFVPKKGSYPIIEMIDGATYTSVFQLVEIPGYTLTVDYVSPTLVELIIAVSPFSPTLVINALKGNRKILAKYINGFPNALVYLNQLPFGELEQALDRLSPARNYANAFALQNTTFAFSYELGSHIRNRRLLKQKTPSIEVAINEQLFAMADEYEMPSETLPADLQNEEMKEDPNSQNEKQEEKPNLYPQPGTPVLVKPLPNHYQVWISGFGEFSHQNATALNQNPAFHFNAAGPLVGFDFGGESGLVGAAGGYAKNTIQMAGDFGSASSDSAIFMAYGSYYGTPFFFDLSLLFGGSWLKTSRNISFPEFSAVASEKHFAWVLDPHLDFGYYFDFGMLGLEPYASLDAAIVFEDNYSENGAYPYNFSQPSHNSELLRSEVGLASYQQKSFWGVTLLFKESLSYVNKTPWGSMTTGFVGSPASITLETISDTQNLISPTFEFFIQWGEFTFSAMYEGEFGSQYHSNEVFGTFSYGF